MIGNLLVQAMVKDGVDVPEAEKVSQEIDAHQTLFIGEPPTGFLTFRTSPKGVHILYAFILKEHRGKTSFIVLRREMRDTLKGRFYWKSRRRKRPCNKGKGVV